MNTEKQVFNKLFSEEKIELASQKFEFGAIEDMRAKLNQMAGLMDIQSEVIAAENKLKKAFAISEDVKKQSFDIGQKIKAMGMMDMYPAVDKINKEASDASKSAQTMIAYLQKAI